MLAFACAFTMFAGAASFTDEADISENNRDAVELLTTLGIIKGYEDGSFDPEGTVDRAEMAKMIYTIRNGGNDDASAHVGNTTSFTDISGHWAEGYIKYLQNTGIVAGKSATQFAPDAQVTTAEAMKMALALAGYDEKNAGLTGIDWQKNTLTYATTIGLTDDVNSAMSAGCTRQDAAQILANALGATAVRYSAVVENFVNDSKSGLSFGGDPISVGRKWMDLWTSVGTLTIIDGKELAIAPTKSDLTDSDKDDDGNVVTEFINVNTDYSDLLGQKVKVLFNDGKNNSVIGVYAVPANDIVTVYQNEIDAEDAKIEIGDTLYTLENNGVITIIDGVRQNKNWHSVDFVDDNSPDVVTLVDTDENGKIDTAVIKTVDVVKVSFVSSSQIIAGNTTYKFSEENIAEDVEKNDWVMITENLYDDCKDIEVVEMATGAVSATRGTTFPADEYQIGDNWFIAAEDDSDINPAVKAGVDAEYIAVNNILFYAKRVVDSNSDLDDILFVALVGQDGLTNDQARVMFPNGDKATITLSDKNYDSNPYDDDDSKDAPIVAGQFYEFSKSGDEYELSAVFDAVGAAHEDYKDYYGEYTYWGTEDENGNPNQLTEDGTAIAADGDYADAVSNVAAIADSADVILYLPRINGVKVNINDNGADAANINGYEIKHITGKQLKSNATLDGATLDAEVLGVFSSSVNNLKRASVIAVLYTGDNWAGDTGNLRSDAHYGLITGDVKDLGSTISFNLATEEYEDIVTVVADENNTRGFGKGVIIGYSEIEQDDNGNNIIKDAKIVDDAKIGTITAWNNDTIELYSYTDGRTIELDRGDFNTEVYTYTENNNIIKDAAGEPNDLDDGRVNILYWENSFAFIDANEIIGQKYANQPVVYTGVLDSDGKINSALIRSMEWENASTGETWDGIALQSIYDHANMNLGVTSNRAGVLRVFVDGDLAATYEFTNAGQKIEKSFVVDGRVTMSWNQNADGSAQIDNITIRLADGVSADGFDVESFKTSIDRNGKLTISIPLKDGITRYTTVNEVYVDGIPTGDGMGQASIRGGEQVWTKSLNIDTANEVEIVFTDVAVTYDDFGYAAEGMIINSATSGNNTTYTLSGNVAAAQPNDVIGTDKVEDLFDTDESYYIGGNVKYTVITFDRSNLPAGTNSFKQINPGFTKLYNEDQLRKDTPNFENENGQWVKKHSKTTDELALFVCDGDTVTLACYDSSDNFIGNIVFNASSLNIQ